MIKTHETYDIGNLKAEVNWNEEVTPCKVIRFTIDGKTTEVEHSELYVLLMMFGNDQEQEEMIPTKEIKMRAIRRLLHVKVKKDLKAGELLIFPYRYDVTEETYQKLIKEHPREYTDGASLSTAVDTLAKVGGAV